MVFLVATTALYTDLVRLANPVGEKYVPFFAPGQNDFSYPYVGARALIAGVNPYRNDNPEFTSSIFHTERIAGVEFKQVYPPGHFLLFAPLALWKGADWQAAARLWFRFNVVALALLAALTWALARRLVETPLSPLWIPVFYVCLTLNPGTELGLERGQSDILVALLCWISVLCVLRGAWGPAMFLAIWGVTIKGYPILFAAGLGLLGLERGRRKGTLLGAGVAAAVLILPVARTLGDAARALRFRADMFRPAWYNHGFRIFVYRFAPAWADRGRLMLSAFALAVTVLAWTKARRAFRKGTPAELALWVSVYAIASLGTMLGYSSLSASYNLILISPGLLILGISQERIRSLLALSIPMEHTLGATLLGCSFLLFVCRLDADPVPAAALGLVLLFPILAGILIRGLAHRTEPRPNPRPRPQS